MENLDWGKTSSDYARYRLGFPDTFYDRVFDEAIIAEGDTLLDLGTGTGALARGFAARGCQVTGADIAAPQLAAAAELANRENLTIDFLEAAAEETGLAGQSFDVVTAGQCWHWFDRPRAAVEAMRIVKSAGCLVVAYIDWLPLPGSMVEATEALIEAHNPAWTMGGGDGRYPHWQADIETAGFSGISVFEYDVEVHYDHESWRGRIRASGGVGGTLDEPAVKRFDAQHAEMLADQFPDDALSVPHRVWVLTARKP